VKGKSVISSLHCRGDSKRTYIFVSGFLLFACPMFPGLIAYDGVLVCDHVEAAGEELFALACKRDLEDIMARHKFGPYLQDSAQWFKIRNRKYSQW